MNASAQTGLLTDDDHNGEIGFSGVNCTQRFAGLFELYVPARFHAARAVLNFPTASESLFDLPAECGKNRGLDVFCNLFQGGAVPFVSYVNHKW